VYAEFQNQEREEVEAEQRAYEELQHQERIAQFHRERDTIMAAARDALQAEKYQDVLRQTKPYARSGDEELMALRAQAREKFIEKQNAIREKKRAQKKEREAKKLAAELERAIPAWTTSSSTDEMTGKLSAHAQSPVTYPSTQMSFPYHEVKSWMGVGCNSTSEWTYIGFSTAPNLVNDITKDGYNLIHTRVRWNDTVKNVKLTQDWGSKFIHFANNATAIKNIAASNTALLELHWHGQESVYFNYSFKGSSKAISAIRAKCSG
jgi:hypothetical protein